MSRVSLCSAASLTALVLTLISPYPWLAAQPPGANPDAPNPLDLARGLRDQGMADLALEYLQDLAAKPSVPESVKDQIPLERAKCQLDAAVDEPDEGTRISLIGEAKEGFFTFVRNPKNANHARMPEAFLSLARLTSMDAKAQLTRARRMDVPQLNENASNQAEVDDAKKKQKEEAGKARPLFDAAAGQLKNAVTQIQAQLDKNPDAGTKKSLLQTLYDAEIARGTNQFTLSETYLDASTMELAERDKKLDEAIAIFADLIKLEGAPARVTGVARAWISECYSAKKEIAKAEEEVKRIEASTGPDSEEAKRMIRFFKVRKEFLSAVSAPNERGLAETHCRDWLRQYGSLKRAQSEAFAIRWYLGFLLELQANSLLPPPPKVPPKTPQPPAPIPATARLRYQEAEKLFRLISQSDNEYTQRASRERMYVVRKLLGEADQPPSAYKTFEECQMASLIQMARMLDLQKEGNKPEEVKARQHAIVALLERARDLATPQDNPADVADVNIRLIDFYRLTGQPYESAVLGEFIARTTKTPGGKSALAGAKALIGYNAAFGQIKNIEAERLEGVRKTDRDRAINLAAFIDKVFPNDPATDSARRNLAGLLYEDQKPVEAYDALLKIRPGYEGIASARLFQGAIAYQLLAAKDSPLAENRRRDVFRRTTSDLDKLVKPLPTAAEEEIRPYMFARWRLTLLYNLEPRVDPEGNKIDPGYAKSRRVADDMLAAVPTFHALVADIGTKSLNLDGWEMKLLAEDAKVKAAVLQGTTLFAQGKNDEAYKAIGDLLAEMNSGGPFVQQVKAITAAGPKPPAKKEPEPAPKKEPEKKEPEKKDAKKDPEAKKEPEKKAPEAKKEPELAPADDDADKAQKELLVKRAEEVDKTRQTLVVLALKIRVKKGEAEKGIEQLELLKKFGGSIEANISTLEQITAEMASQIQQLRREGKGAEAKSLADGFGKLLDKLSAEPNLPASIQRFLGQSLILVGEYGKAVEALKKVPPPADPKLLFAKAADIADPVMKRTVAEYRRAELELLRAYRGAGQFTEADAILAGAMGTPEKPGWAANSVDFRKEKATLFEAKGAAAQGPAAKQAWGEALREWGALANIYRAQVAQGPPPGAGGGNIYLTTQNNYFEMYLQQRRCLLKANQQLLPKGDPKFAKFYEDAGKSFADLEMINGNRFNDDVREKYHDLLMEIPEVKAAYEKAATENKGKAKALGTQRRKDAEELAKKAEGLPADSPEKPKVEARVKLLNDEAAWMDSWSENKDLKIFVQKPGPTN